MATIRKSGSLWQAQIRKKGHKPVSRSFTKKSDATLWAKKVESEVEHQIYLDLSVAQTTKPSEVLERYSKEILPTKKSDETYRLNLLKSSLGSFNLIDIKPYVIAQCRDQRLHLVKPASARKELGLLSRVLNTVAKDWGINLPDEISVSQIRLPAPSAGRDRRLTKKEETTTHVAFEPKNFIARLETLPPVLRVNLTCYHNVFALSYC